MSEIRANTISAANGTDPATLTGQWASKMQLSYDQTVPSVQSSENVSSVTDDAAGQFTINTTNAFAAATYPVTTGAFHITGPNLAFAAVDDTGTGRGTSAIDMRCHFVNNVSADETTFTSATGDLA